MHEPVAPEDLARVIVVGTSGSGKTAFARQLANALGSVHIELDALYWNRGWQPKPESEFLHLVEAATSTPQWVVDGNYQVARNVLWPRATAIIWLNLGFITVFGRVLLRSLRRGALGEPLYSGNRESLSRSFLSSESILLWVVRTYRLRRSEYQALKSGGRFPNLRWLEFRRQGEAADFLHNVQRAA